MMSTSKFPGLILFSLLLCSCGMGRGEVETETVVEESPEKELYIPEEVYRVPAGNDYTDNESDYSFERMAESENFALFWHKEYGQDPSVNQNENKTFDVDSVLAVSEIVYDTYVNDLKIVDKGNSVTDKYKLLIYVFGGDEGTAFGGGEEDKVGILWTNATRINKPPYGVIAHEIAHSFQYLSRADAGTGPRGPIGEMSAQYMLWHVYPEWMTFENYHLKDFMDKTHYAFLHPTNMYHSPYVLEYWSGKHGKDFFGKLSRATQEGEDVVMTYKRLNNLSQKEFNDEMFDAVRRFITWDLPRIEEVASPYANQHKSTMVDAGDGWYKIAPAHAPQNYGYNGIQLQVPSAGTEVELEFKGIPGAEGYSSVKTDQAGWRYGFVASLSDGSRVYGDVHRDVEDRVSFEVPKNTEYLWLVVMGAPTEHWPRPRRSRNASEDEFPEEAWPYKIRLKGTSLGDSVTIKHQV